MLSIALYIIAIIACGGLGGLAGWLASQALGWSGVPAALLAAAVGMVVAVAAWALGVVVYDRIRK